MVEAGLTKESVNLRSSFISKIYQYKTQTVTEIHRCTDYQTVTIFKENQKE